MRRRARPPRARRGRSGAPCGSGWRRASSRSPCARRPRPGRRSRSGRSGRSPLRSPDPVPAPRVSLWSRSPSTSILDVTLRRRTLAAGVAGVRGPARLDQQDMSLLVRARAVLDAARDDEDLARVELDVPLAELDRQVPFQDEKEIVGVGMGVPDELALNLDELELVVVQVADDAGAEGLVEGGELVGEIDLVVHRRCREAEARMPGPALLAQLVEHLHGKEGVDGSSPSEGSAKAPEIGAFPFDCTCTISSVRQVWSPLWSLQVQ